MIKVAFKAGVGGRLVSAVKTSADAAVAAAGLGEIDKRKVLFVALLFTSPFYAM